MPKTKVKRLYYRNGQVHEETRYRGGLSHGFWRTWHRNGVLASEERYVRGKLNGLCREWADDGRLLGEFRMNRGTGIQHHWFDDGRPRMEISTVDGKFTGRVRHWMRDAILVKEKFYIAASTVSRKTYLETARSHSDWPQYRGESAGRPAKRSRQLDKREFELFVASLLKKPNHAEAREWLSAAAKTPRTESRSLGRFKSPKAALQFVEKLYAAGASSVIVPAIYGGKKGTLFAESLLVELPKAGAKRKSVRKLCKSFSRERDAACEPEKDIGESHLYLLME